MSAYAYMLQEKVGDGWLGLPTSQTHSIDMILRSLASVPASVPGEYRAVVITRPNVPDDYTYRVTHVLVPVESV